MTFYRLQVSQDRLGRPVVAEVMVTLDFRPREISSPAQSTLKGQYGFETSSVGK